MRTIRSGWKFGAVGVVVAASLLVAIPRSEATFPGTNGLIAWSTGSILFTARPDGTQAAPRGSGANPAWSADGISLVFDRNGDIWKMLANGAGLTQVTNTSATDNQPVFSPDGTKIAFASNRSGQFRIWKANADGSSPVAVTATGALPAGSEDASPDWSPNGERIVFSRGVPADGAGARDIFSTKADGTDLKRLTSGAVAPGGGAYDKLVNPKWSPNSAKVTYGLEAGCKIFTVNADATGAAAVGAFTGCATDPAYSPDGTLIIFRLANPGAPQGPGLYGFRPSNSTLAQLVNDASAMSPDWQALAGPPPPTTTTVTTPTTVAPTTTTTTVVPPVTGWGAAELVSDAGNNPRAVAVSTPSGSVAGYWQQGSNAFVYRRHSSGGWTAERTLAAASNSLEEQLAITATDSVVYAAISLRATNQQIRYVEHNGTAISRSLELGAGSQPSIARDTAGIVTVVARRGNNLVAWRIPATGAAPAPLTINSSDTMGGHSVVNGGSNVPIVVWTQCDPTRGSCLNGGSKVFKFSRFTAGAWSAPGTYTVTGSPQLFTLASAGSRVVLAWNRAGDNAIAASQFGTVWATESAVSSTAGGPNRVPAIAITPTFDTAILVPNQKFFTKRAGVATWTVGPDFPAQSLCDAGAGFLPLVFESGRAVGFAATRNASNTCSRLVAYRSVSTAPPTTTSTSTTTTTTIPPPVAGATKPLVVRSGTWFFRNTFTSGNADTSFGYGDVSDRPVTGDWDGDGDITVGVVRSAQWMLRNASGGVSFDVPPFVFGNTTDIAVTGDWDDNGTWTPGVYRNGVWYLRNTLTSGNADVVVSYGNATGDTPVAGDWNGDGRTTVGIFRAGTWYLRNAEGGGAADVTPFVYGNASGDIPIAGDWNGNGTFTPGIFREGSWFLRNGAGGGVADVPPFIFGQAGDRARIWR